MKLKQRMSHFEMLRIVSMSMIVLSHMTGWGKVIRYADGALAVLAPLIQYGGKFWVSVLVVLGAHFACSGGVRFRSIFHIVFSTTLVQLGCVLLKPELYGGVGGLLKAAAMSFFPVSNRYYWFVTVYVFLLLLSPWLNVVIRSISKREYQWLLAVSTGIFCVPYALKLPAHSEVTSGMLWFLYLYVVSGYITRFPPDFTKKRWLMLFGACLAYALMYVFTECTGNSHYAEMGSFLMAAGAACLFCFVRESPMKHSRVVNWIAGGCFMVYLVHDAEMLRHFWWIKIFRCDVWGHSAWYIPGGILIVVFFLLLGAVLNSVARWMEKQLFRLGMMQRLSAAADAALRVGAE